jgi:hypothetical protein
MLTPGRKESEPESAEVSMSIESSRSEQLRSALFVDFDNIYIGLENQFSTSIANNFASNPEKWTSWIERNATIASNGARPGGRRLLLRRCYMNPENFSPFRRKLTQAAFDVIDCPKLTDQGKTCTDIHLIMDVLDALAHPVHLDEFVILSGDADFTPLLRRLRRHDRFTTILSPGLAAAAYKASCDSIIPVDDFLCKALMISSQALNQTIDQNRVPTPSAVVSAEQPGLSPEVKKESLCRSADTRQTIKSGGSKMEELISKIHEATDVPDLSHKQYTALFEALANEINDNGYKSDETSRAVQMRCAAKRITVMEGNVDSVIEGCNREHHWFKMGAESAKGIAEGYLKYIKDLCRMKKVALNERELEMLHLWVLGKGSTKTTGALAN